jgi:hypothetical protein
LLISFLVLLIPTSLIHGKQLFALSGLMSWWKAQARQKYWCVIIALIIERLTNTLDAGDIYLGIDIISGEEVGIKLEFVKAKHPQLEYESKVYKTLAGGVGVPFV